MLNLLQTTDVVIIWIKSVKTLQQLKLARDAVDTFIIDRFATSPPKDLLKARHQVEDVLYDKESEIIV